MPNVLTRGVDEGNTTYYCTKKFKVKSKAFRPNSDNETSMYRVENMVEADIWPMLKNELGRTIFGRAQLEEELIVPHFPKGLSLEFDEDPSRHVNMKWSMSQELELATCQALAAVATCIKKS